MNNKKVDKLIKGYEKEFKEDRGLKKSLNNEIDIREKRYREEMFNLDSNLRGKSKEEVIKILNGMEERAQELIGYIDSRVNELNNELDNIKKKGREENKKMDRGIIIISIIGGCVIIGIVIGFLIDWIR